MAAEPVRSATRRPQQPGRVIAIAAIALVLGCGQRWPAMNPTLGPSEEVRAPKDDGMPGEDVAQFENLDDSLLRPLETPTLPNEEDIQPFGEPLIEEQPSEAAEPSAEPQTITPQTDPSLESVPLNALEPVPLDDGPPAPSDDSESSPRRVRKPIWSRDAVEPDRDLSDETFQEFGTEEAGPTLGPRLDPQSDFAPNESVPPADAGDPDFPPPFDPSALEPQPADDANDQAPTTRRALRVSQLPRGAEAVRLAIAGQFLGELFASNGCSSGAVNDVVMNARVTGFQTTRTTTRLNLIPDAGTARMSLVLDGTSQSNTVGRTDQAAIVSYGNHRFQLEKPISFDGQQFLTSSPGAYVWPSQQTAGATASVGQRLPVVRRMASRIAYDEARRRQPASERIAANRLTGRVSETFNAKADAGLGKLQAAWQEKALDRLAQLMLDPQAPRTSTTSRHLVLALPTSTARPETQPPAQWTGAGPSLSLALHESAINAALARLPLAGRELRGGEWNAMVSRVLPSATTDPGFATDPRVPSSLATLRLVDDDPVTVRFARGAVEIELRAVVSTPLGDSPPQLIVMPWRVSVDAARTQLTSDPVQVSAIGTEDGSMMDVVREGIETRFNDEIAPLRLPRTLSAPLGEDRELPLTLTFFRSRDGWLILGWRKD